MPVNDSSAAFETDRNLLFGVLALQADLLDTGRFAEACAAWAARKGRPLADLLVERGWLTPQDRADVDRLLERKLKKHAGDASAGLAAAANPTVLETLGMLHDADVQQSLAGLPEARGPAAAGGPAPGETIDYIPAGRGRYTLTTLHARGGIGQVWLARDTDLGRDVALKEPRPDRADSAAVLARFLEEARITGQLEHPGIVPVYELARRRGDGRPFYAMRFVRGRTLAEASKEFQAQRQTGKAGRLQLRELVGAFVAVCNAVAFAHSRGVVHRDLKGRNVVLGDFGEVVVLDWGLAKLVEESGGTVLGAPVAMEPGAHDETGHGQILGTPAFMAPEQAAGNSARVDRRTDVYGLGALLYEVLTSEPPFSGSDSQEVLRKVARDAPVPPRQRSPGVPAALEAVCLKALAKEPEKRYPSARQLADDVRHWLDDEPVAAYPDPVLTRLRRWGRRHRPLVAAAAALLLALVAALTVGTVLLGKANAQTQRARREAEGQRDLARENFDKARQAVDDYFTQVSENKLLKSPLPGLLPLRKELLESALKYYREFAEQHQDDPAVQAELAQAYYRVGRITAEIGSKAEAAKAYEQSRTLWERLAAAEPGAEEIRQGLADCCRQLGSVRGRYLGQPDAGLEALGRARDVAEPLARDHPNDPKIQGTLAWIYEALGDWHEQQGQSSMGLEFYEKALAIWRQLARDDPEYRSEVASALMTIGYYRASNFEADEALRCHNEARAILEELLHDQPYDTGLRMELRRAYLNIGYAHHNLTGRYDEALRWYGKARDIAKELARDNPTVTVYQRSWAGTELQISFVQRQVGRFDREGEAAERVLAIAADTARIDPDNIQILDHQALAYWLRGDAYRHAGQLEEARTCFTAARDHGQRLVKIHPGNTTYLQMLARYWAHLGAAQHQLGQMGPATESHQKTRALLDQLVRDHARDSDIVENAARECTEFGDLQREIGQHAEAAESYRRAEVLLRGLKEDPDNFSLRGDLALACLGLGAVQAAGGKPAEALPALREARTLLEGLARPRPEDLYALAVVRALLSYLPEGATDADQAMEALQKAVAAGYQNVTQLRTAPDSGPLRQRPDFTKLVEDVAKRTASGN